MSKANEFFSVKAINPLKLEIEAEVFAETEEITLDTIESIHKKATELAGKYKGSFIAFHANAALANNDFNGALVSINKAIKSL